MTGHDRRIRDNLTVVPGPYDVLRRLEPPADLLDAVMNQVAETPQRQGAFRVQAWARLAMGVAATVVVALLVANLVLFTGTPRVGPPAPSEPPASTTATGDGVTSLSVPSPMPVAVAAEIEVPGVHALQVIASDDAVWMLGDNNTLYAIDPASNEILEQFPVPHNVPAGAIGFGSAWFADTGLDVLRRIDLATGDVVAEIGVGDRPETVSVGPDAVWVSNLHSGTISRVNPATNAVVANVEVGNPGSSGPKWIGIGNGDVWVSVPNRNAVVRVDASTNEVLASVPVDTAALACGDVLVQPAAVWVSSCDEREALIRVDRASEAGQALLVPGTVHGIVEVGELVAFTLNRRGDDSTIVLMDPENGDVVRNVNLGPGTFFSIESAFDSLWVANESGGPVLRVDFEELLP